MESFDDFKEALKKLPVNLTLHLVLITIYFLGWAILALATEPWKVLDPSLIWLGVALAHYGLSWRFYDPVAADELGVRLLFGKPIDVVESGPPFLPLGLMSLVSFKRTVHQREFPAEPENVYEGEMKDREKLPEGMKPPIRITFRSSITQKKAEQLFRKEDLTVAEFSRVNLQQLREDAEQAGDTDTLKLLHSDFWSDYTRSELQRIENLPDMPNVTFKPIVPTDGLARRVTANVVPVVRWKILKAIDFMQNIGTEEEVDRQIEDEMVSVLQRLLPKMSAGQAMENMEWINAHLFDSVIRRTLNWGILVEGAYLKKLPFHHSLNRAIADATEAEFIGRSDKELAMQRGEGAAAAARKMEEEVLLGRAMGLKQMAADLGVTGAEVQAAEVARAIGDKGNTIVMGTDGFAQLGGVVAAMAKPKTQSPAAAPQSAPQPPASADQQPPSP